MEIDRRAEEASRSHLPPACTPVMMAWWWDWSGGTVSRPYGSFQIDRLEAEFERASDEEDGDALKHLKDELARRKQTPRVARLLRQLSGTGVQGAAPAGQTPASGPAAPPKRPPASSSQRRPGGKPPSFKPTLEQEQAVAAFGTGESLKINAYAGSGKTSTLQLLAHSSPRKGQYLAFNKKIVTDSQDKFPSDVDCNTTHSVAFRSLKGRYSTPKLTGKIQPNHLVELLQLKNWRVDRNHVLAARSQAYLILATIRRFCQSDAPDLALEHVPRHGSLAAAPDEVIQQVAKAALDGATHVWGRMLAADDECDFVVSTAHKAKGREWPQVRLMDDFLKSLPKKEGGQPTATVDPSELRLLYVALTRAQDVLEVPSGLMEFLNTGKLPASALTPGAVTPQRRGAATTNRQMLPVSVQSPAPAWEPPTNWTPSPRPTAPTAIARVTSPAHRHTVPHEIKPMAIGNTAHPDVPSQPIRQEPPPLPARPAAATEPPKKKTGFFRWLMGG